MATTRTTTVLGVQGHTDQCTTSASSTKSIKDHADGNSTGGWHTAQQIQTSNTEDGSADHHHGRTTST
jgi:hypothetical protein